MKRLIANSTIGLGIIDGIERNSREKPAALDLQRFHERKNNAYRVKAALLSWEFDQKIKKEEKDEFLANITRRKIRNKASEAIDKREEGELSGNAKSRYTMRRNQAMQAMIVDGVWSKELAKMYDITKEDVQVHHTQEMRMTVFLNYSTHNEFKNFLRKKALKAFQIEKQKLDTYLEGVKAKGVKGMLRILLASMNFQQQNKLPRLLIEQKLYARNEKGKSEIEVLYDEKNAYKTTKDEFGERGWMHNGEKISQHEYKRGKAEIEGRLHKLQKQNHQLYKLFFLDNESNENMTYIKAIGKKELQTYTDRMTQFEQDTTGLVTKPHIGVISIHVTSVGQGKELIEKYCGWYNEKFKSEIDATKAEEELKRTAEKNEKNRIGNRTKKLDRDRRIIELRENGERNAVKIAEVVNEKERTVRDILDRYDAVLELYRKGVTIPEAITELLKTKLPTVILYLEVFTGDSINANTLTSEQQRQLELERLQEAQARIEMEEREFRKLERERINFWKTERENNVIRLHKNGWNPSNIHKFVNISITAIKNILEEHNLTPHFDWRLATDEEGEETREKHRLKDQKVAKTRKMIDL